MSGQPPRFAADTDAGRQREEREASPYARALELLLIAVIAWAPIPFGSNRPWAWSLLAALLALLLIAWGAGIALGRIPVRHGTRSLRVPGVLAAIATLWTLVQIAPWTPNAWHHPAWSIAREALAADAGGTIAVAPERAADALLVQFSAIAAFFLAFQLGGAWRGTHWTYGAVAAIAVLQAVYALGVVASGTDTILWYSRGYSSYYNPATGTFINPNNFGTYMGLGLAVLAALVMRGFGESLIARRGVRILALTSIQFLIRSGWLLIAAAIVLAWALFASRSIGAMLAGISGLALALLLGAFAAARRQYPVVSSVLAAGGFAGVLAIFLFAGVPFEAKFAFLSTGGGDAMRADFYAAAWRAIEAAPLLGYGPGSFAYVEPAFATGLYPYAIDKVHNDFLETLLDRGLLFGTVWLGALAWPVVTCVIGVFRRHRTRRWIPLAGVAAAAIIGLHSTIDFGAQIPAIACTFAFVLGVASRGAFGSRSRSGEPRGR